MVYYRKYRPQRIGDLDSTTVRETLTAVLSSKNIPHAFLFTGPKGLGKTSTARIIAKVVNCTSSQKDRKNGFEPCNSCESCLSITNGSNIDILEIDGASNRGIDEIRDLRDRVKLAPSNAKKKVYIIDEVHMLTTEAFNALLKTIEEPPEHVMFVFATTEPQKVPATILSRCFHVSFPRATDEDIIHSLERIVSGEKLQIEKDALQTIAELADGGFRDGAKILEELVAVAGEGKITKDLVQDHYKTQVSFQITPFRIALYDKDLQEGIRIINQLVALGGDIKYFLTRVFQELQVDLTTNVGARNENESREVKRFNNDQIRILARLFSDAYQQMKYSVIPQLPLELAVIEWCSDKTTEKSDEHIGQVASSTAKSGPTIAEVRKKEQTLKVRSIIEGKKDEKPAKPVVGVDQGIIRHDLDELSQLMENIIYKVKPYNHSIAGVLRGCDIVSVTDGQMIFGTGYKFHKERLDDMKTKEILEKVVKEITGKQMKILIELKA